MRHKRPMTGEDELPPEQDLALAYARARDRPAIEAVLRLDKNLGRAVAQASEPIVGQLKLAWWRDALSASPEARPQGNPLLETLSANFGSDTRCLVALVDGWESLLVSDPLSAGSIELLLAGREVAWRLIASRLAPGENMTHVAAAARRWALADLLAGLGDEHERAIALSLAASEVRPPRLSRQLRPLAVLAALASGAIARGGLPLLADRRAALVALRSGLFGR